ncbi:MAG TPA: SdpI family protein [Burkholderiales bacterium]|nr:SdpI family protein [Burkholderiales bacterium]
MDSAFSFLLPCGIIALASIPLMLNLVPPNEFYGFRTRQTLASRELWFRANRFAGCALFLASGASAAIFTFLPEYASGRSFIGLVVYLVPLVAALGASFAYVRRVGGGVER